MLKDFYENFAPLVDNAFKNMEKKKPEETGEKCPECGSPLVIRKGKYGQFTACSNYPTCKYIKKSWYKPTGEKCKNCNDLLVIKNGEIICPICDE